MAQSSMATYLDVTQNAAPTSQSPPPAVDPKSTEQAAKTLAAVNQGAQVATEITAHSGLELPETVSALGWLAQAGLITLAGDGDQLRAELTPAAREALTG